MCKVKLPLCLTKHHAMKAYGEVKVWLHASLTSATDGGEWSASRPCRLHPRKEPRYPLDRRLGGPQSRYECGGGEKKIPAPAGNQTPVVQPVAQSLHWLSYLSPVIDITPWCRVYLLQLLVTQTVKIFPAGISLTEFTKVHHQTPFRASSIPYELLLL
jgi:hypothetical protein